MLAGINDHPDIRDAWVFKGGTCLKKCFFETYRFSEDLDFTLRDPAHLDEEFLSRVLAEVADRVYQNAGIHALTYDFHEVFAEKTRALAERTRPGDLHDVINLYRRPEAQADRDDIRAVLAEKCAFKKISVPKLGDLLPFRDDVSATWGQMLDHQLPQLLSFETFWDELPNFFSWLEVKLEIQATAPVGGRAGEVPIYASQPLPRLPSVPGGIMGRLRFAAANRLLVDLDYETLGGRRSTRLVEPYSLRQSSERNVLFYAIRDDSGQVRAYRVDHIRGATVTNRTFIPRYTIELTMTGLEAVQPVPLGSGGF